MIEIVRVVETGFQAWDMWDSNQQYYHVTCFGEQLTVTQGLMSKTPIVSKRVAAPLTFDEVKTCLANKFTFKG